MFKNAKFIKIILAHAEAKGEHLSVFVDTEAEFNPWQPVDVAELFDPRDERDFFLCLPKHAEALLENLNGGECQLFMLDGDKEYNHCVSNELKGWSIGSWYMFDHYESRIKPKTEKRWIAVDASTSQCTRHYSTKESCFNSEFAGCEGNASGWQFIEIEVEV